MSTLYGALCIHKALRCKLEQSLEDRKEYTTFIFLPEKRDVRILMSQIGYAEVAISSVVCI